MTVSNNEWCRDKMVHAFFKLLSEPNLEFGIGYDMAASTQNKANFLNKGVFTIEIETQISNASLLHTYS